MSEKVLRHVGLALRGETAKFKERIAAGETLDDILPRAFAVVREAARRTLGQRPFDSQLMGGMVLHRGAVAEMMTGEGKTLAAVAPTYLNALAGKGAHVVTVNEYLARRDAVWMGQIYRALGLTAPQFYHCPLVADEAGVRLAKRHDSLSLRALRSQGASPAQLRDLAYFRNAESS